MYKNNSRFISKFKGCSPLQLLCILTGMKLANGYYSYTKRSCAILPSVGLRRNGRSEALCALRGRPAPSFPPHPGRSDFAEHPRSAHSDDSDFQKNLCFAQTLFPKISASERPFAAPVRHHYA